MTREAWQQCAQLSGKSVKELQTQVVNKRMTTERMIRYLESKGAKVSMGKSGKNGQNGFNFEHNHIEQGGVVINQVTDCFPASAQVLTRAGGVLRMDELKVGDCVQAYDVANGCAQWSIVTAFIHRETHGMQEYVQVDTADGARVQATREHRVFTPGGDVYTNSVRVGSAVYTVSPDGMVQASEVTSVRASKEVGLYCPLTASGTVVVDSVAYSCHANCTHRIGNILYSPLRWGVGLFSVPELDGIHPYSKAIAYLGLTLGCIIPRSIRCVVLANGLHTKISMFEEGELQHYRRPKACGAPSMIMCAGVLMTAVLICMELWPRIVH